MKNAKENCIMLDKVHEVYGQALAFCFSQNNPCDREEFLQQIDFLRSLAKECGFSDLPDMVHMGEEDISAVKKHVCKAFAWSGVMHVWLEVICDAGRVRHIEGAALVCRRIIMRGYETLYVESAHKLSVREKKQLEVFGKEKLGEHAGVAYTIKPDLLAGVRLRKGWREVDLSLQSHIVQLKEDLYRC